MAYKTKCACVCRPAQELVLVLLAVSVLVGVAKAWKLLGICAAELLGWHSPKPASTSSVNTTVQMLAQVLERSQKTVNLMGDPVHGEEEG